MNAIMLTRSVVHATGPWIYTCGHGRALAWSPATGHRQLRRGSIIQIHGVPAIVRYIAASGRVYLLGGYETTVGAWLHGHDRDGANITWDGVCERSFRIGGVK